MTGGVDADIFRSDLLYFVLTVSSMKEGNRKAVGNQQDTAGTTRLAENATSSTKTNYLAIKNIQ